MGLKEDIQEALSRPDLTDDKRALLTELAKRKGFDIGSQKTKELSFAERHPEVLTAKELRKQALTDMANEMSTIQSLFVNMGKGLYNIGRGVGLADEPSALEKEQFDILSEEKPYSSTIGEATGEALPFVPLAFVGAGGLAAQGGRTLIPVAESTMARIATGGAMGAIEGAISSKGRGEDPTIGGVTGGTIGIGAEILFPIMGNLGRKIFQKVMGKAPKGALIDASGKPTTELIEALDKAGMSFDDLTDDALSSILGAEPGSDLVQASRKALFQQEGIPASKGEITQNFKQLKDEYNLFGSATDKGSEQFRQFKLEQSQAINDRLNSLFGRDVSQEETGQVLKGALEGKYDLLRNAKNDLYEFAASESSNLRDIPFFTDELRRAIPDADSFEDFAITAPQAMDSFKKLMKRYGIIAPSKEEIAAGFKPKELNVASFERFRKSLNRIRRLDTTGAADEAIRPVLEALDSEADDLAKSIGDEALENAPTDFLDAYKLARETVRQMKTEFSPQSLVGKLISTRKDNVTDIIPASKVYNQLSRKSTSVEDVRKVIKSLSGPEIGEEGIKAKAALQTSTLLDLIDAGFSSNSKTVSGQKLFDPKNFTKRVKNIGEAKLRSIFIDSPETFKAIRNIDKIAKDIIPPEGATKMQPKNQVMALSRRLGLLALASKVPGGIYMLEGMRTLTQPIKGAVKTRQAISSNPEVRQAVSVLDRQFAGLSRALGIPYLIEEGDNNE